MRQIKTKLLLILLSVIIGELCLVLLTTLVQEGIFQGIRYTTSSLPELIIGGFLTFLAAVGAGILSAMSSGRALHIVPSILSFLITLEMIYLISAGLTDDPMWFDIFAGFSLIVGIWLGYYGWFRNKFGRSYK